MVRRTGLAVKTGTKSDETGPGDVPPGVICDAEKTPDVEDDLNTHSKNRC